MRRLIYAILLVTLSINSVLSEEAYKPSSEMYSALTPALIKALQSENDKQCKTRDLGTDYCAQSSAILSVYAFKNGKFEKAKSDLDDYKKYEIWSSGWTPCYWKVFQIADGGPYYRFEYYQSLYAINHAKRDKPYAHDLRAFLCAAFDSDNFSLNAEGMGRRQFNEYVAKYHGGDDRYGVDLYLTDINAVIDRGFKDIRKGTKFGRDYRRDTLDSVKLAALYRNAAKRARKIGLAPEFVSFLEEWQKFREEVAVKQAEDGGVD